MYNKRCWRNFHYIIKRNKSVANSYIAFEVQSILWLWQFGPKIFGRRHMPLDASSWQMLMHALLNASDTSELDVCSMQKQNYTALHDSDVRPSA